MLGERFVFQSGGRFNKTERAHRLEHEKTAERRERARGKQRRKKNRKEKKRGMMERDEEQARNTSRAPSW